MFEYKTFIDLFHIASAIKFLLNNIALLDKQFQWQINNQSQELAYVKLDQDILYILVVDSYVIIYKYKIEKQYWERYQMIQTKLY